MRIEAGQVILERKDCRCGDGTQPTGKWKMCTKCKGTGRRGSGRCRECNSRHFSTMPRKPGYVMWYDHDDPMPCTVCNGNYRGFAAENYTDNLPKEVFTEIPIRVGRYNRTMGWAEQHLGAGIYTSIDYGSYKILTDDALIEKVRANLVRSHVSASKMIKSREDMTFATGLAIITGDQGYSVIPLWEDQ